MFNSLKEIISCKKENEFFVRRDFFKKRMDLALNVCFACRNLRIFLSDRDKRVVDKFLKFLVKFEIYP